MKKTLLAFIILSLSYVTSSAQATMENSSWRFSFDSTGIRQAVCRADPFGADLIGRGNSLGNLTLNYKVQDGVWLTAPQDRRTMVHDGSRVTYTDRTIGDVLEIIQTFEMTPDGLDWKIRIANNSRFPILVGDLAVAVPWNRYVENDETDEVFQKVFTKHAFISGDASFFYFTRIGGEGPYPVLLPDPGTPLEYFESKQRSYLAYIRSGKSGSAQNQGSWRQEHTYGHLTPSGQEGSVLEYGFRLFSAGTYSGIRDILYRNGSIDTKVAPGMTLPRGQKASFALRTQCRIDSVTCEYPSSTRLAFRERKGDSQIWDVEFDRLGENKLTVWFDGGRKTYLEFFSCLSPETLLGKRSSFLVNRQQWRDTGRWYDGLYGVFDMVTGQLRGPDNPDYFDEKTTYFLASDDPILGKAPFLASKNAVFPDRDEIRSLEYHLEHFVWGGLQRTDRETPLQYGVYGTPNWYINRHQDLRETYSEYKLETTRTWRTYDYPHVFMLWWEMYKIASRYPELCSYASAEEYLERAYQTAKVYWRYPTELLGEYYETFKWGAYNENVIPEIMEELDRLGMHAQADTLRSGWEKKVDYFVNEGYYPYRSEYATDRTAFESTYALADYGMKHSTGKKAEAAVRDFMDRQFLANLSCRGVLENQWSVLGSDFLGASDGHAMTYMSRMGGWGVLEYGLHYAEDPYDAIRLGYSSYLGSFGLVNAGDEESGYGYWYPGKDKDGAIGQAFTNYKYSSAWIGTMEGRGPWRYCGEGDLGLCAVTRTARTILAEDPVFGWTVYGAREFRAGKDGFSFIPDDGMRERLSLVSDIRRFDASIDRDNWSSSKPVRIDSKLSMVELEIENGSGTSHQTVLRLSSARAVTMDGKRLSPARSRDSSGQLVYTLPVSAAAHILKIIF